MTAGAGTSAAAAWVGGVALAGTLGALVLGAAVTVAGARRHRARAGAVTAWAATGLAAVSAVVVGVAGPFGVGWRAGAPGALEGLWADPLTVSLLVLVCGVGALVQSFAARYLAADRRSYRFASLTSLVVLAMAVVSMATTMAILVGAWVAAGAGFVAVVGYRPDLPGARACARRTLVTFAAGDLGLVVALALVWTKAGNLQLAGPAPNGPGAAGLGALALPVAVLAVVAALTRSGQGPMGRWLPGTVSAPTPVSALLHAGVVNGAGILLVRLGALTGASRPAMVAAFGVAVLTVPFAVAAMARRTDVKGHLVFSTVGQMAFMIAECAVGAYVAAVVHLAGHALYKATLFLGSGSQVQRQGAAVALPRPATTRKATAGRVLAAGAAAAVAAGVVAAAPGALAHRGGPVLLVFVAAAPAAAAWSWWPARPRSARHVASAGVLLAVAGAAYGLLLGAFGSWVAGAVPAAGGGVITPWLLLAVPVAALAPRALGLHPGLQRRVTAALLHAGALPATAVTRPQPAAWSGAAAAPAAGAPAAGDVERAA